MIDGMLETHDYFRKAGSFYSAVEKIACIRIDDIGIL